MDFEDFEDKKDALPIGEETMKVKTTRITFKAENKVNNLAILLKDLRKQQPRVTFQDALDFAINFTDENFTQVMGNAKNDHLAMTLQTEIQPKIITHEILQTAIPLQIDEPIQQTVPLQDTNNKKGKPPLGFPTFEAYEKWLNKELEKDAEEKKQINNSKQTEKYNNVIPLTESQIRLKKLMASQ